MREIVIVDRRPEWREEFADIAQRLREAAGDSVLRIDHIGSTAVPGLAAKDVVDVQLTVADLAASQHVPRLRTAGFRLRDQIVRDDFVGLNPGSDELVKQYFREAEGERRTHIHVREQGRLNQRYALVFRDYLRANATVRAAYEVVKRRLAEIFPTDIDGYLSVKDPFMDAVFVAADAWSETTAWTPDDDYV